MGKLIVHLIVCTVMLIGCSHQKPSTTDSGDKTEVASSWAYPFVVWDKKIYEVTSEKVSHVGKEIGEVESYLTDVINDDQSNNTDETNLIQDGQSNYFEKGTKLYEVDGAKTTEAIAIQKENEFVKATFKRNVGE